MSMFALMAVFTIAAAGCALLGVLLLVAFLLKVTFRLVLFPVWLAFGALKLVLLGVLAVAALVFAPLLLVLLLVLALPLLALGGLLALGFGLAAAA
jgi:hypothetical protein